jgi:hypothetical protein
MANDRYCFIVLEESLPEGTIAQHRRSRPKAARHVRAERRRLAKDQAVSRMPAPAARRKVD